MAISQRFKRLFQRITSDSVSCGTLALWAVAMGSLLVIMQFCFNKQLLYEYHNWLFDQNIDTI